MYWNTNYGYCYKLCYGWIVTLDVLKFDVNTEYEDGESVE